MRDSRFTITFLSLVLSNGLRDGSAEPEANCRCASPTSPPPRAFTFTHNAGRAGKKWLPETMGPGCAFFDADGDGWPDILLVNGKDWTGRRRPASTTAALYRNNQQRHLHRHHRGSGLDIEIVRHGRDHRRLRQRRPRRRVHHRARTAIICSTTKAAAIFAMSPREAGDHQRRLRHQRRLARLRSRRQAGSVRRELRAVDPGRRSVVLARRLDQIVLHAGIVQGHVVASSTTIWAAASSRTSPRRPAWAIPPASRWAWPCSTTTAMAGPISSWPTTRSPTSSIATCKTARFKEEGCPRESPSAKTAWRRGAMGADAATTIAPAGRT